MEGTFNYSKIVHEDLEEYKQIIVELWPEIEHEEIIRLFYQSLDSDRFISFTCKKIM